MKFNHYIFILIAGLFSPVALADPYMVVVSELDFSQFLPTTGSCEMNVASGEVTDLLGSQMCISSTKGSIAHYRIIAPTNTNIEIQVNTRHPVNGDGFTFTPVGKITSDIDDVTIIPGQKHVVSSGNLGRVVIKFGGQIIISNQFSPNTTHLIEMEGAIKWAVVP